MEYIKVGNKVLLTDEIMQSGMSRRGAWSRKQLEVLGVRWPLKRGWKRLILGNLFSQESVEHFLALKNLHLKAI